MATTEPGTLYRDAVMAAREESADSLFALADAWAFVVGDSQTFGAIERYLCGERLRAVRDELARREILSRAKAGLASPAERRYQAWRALAGVVRERADMLRVFDVCGHHFVHRQGAKEAHAACPKCGGNDRLVITAGPPDWCWCRQCEWGGDVITVARSFMQLGFRDAVKWLADLCGERIAA